MVLLAIYPHTTTTKSSTLTWSVAAFRCMLTSSFLPHIDTKNPDIPHSPHYMDMSRPKTRNKNMRCNNRTTRVATCDHSRNVAEMAFRYPPPFGSTSPIHAFAISPLPNLPTSHGRGGHYQLGRSRCRPFHSHASSRPPIKPSSSSFRFPSIPDFIIQSCMPYVAP